MTPFETFATDSQEAGRRLEYWNEIACKTSAPVASELADLATFSASLTRTRIGCLCLAEVRSEPATILHTLAQVTHTRDAAFFLVLQLEGTSINRQGERTAQLLPGDFTLCSSILPYEMQLPGAARRLVVGVEDALLRRHLMCPDDSVALRMPGNQGMSGLLSNFLRNLWACRRDTWDAAVGLRMSYTVLDLIAAAYAAIPHAHGERTSTVAAHRARILSYIEGHLRDADLNPARIAQACRITSRYLHHLFAQETQTVTQYIHRRRLEECARALIAAPMPGRQVTEIAFDYGFKSLTHFGRVFRNQYGMTPSEYRTAGKQAPRLPDSALIRPAQPRFVS